MPKETLASMNISLPIMTNRDNCPQPNSTNATAENRPCLRFGIRDVCSKCVCSYNFSVFEFVHYFMNLNYNIFVKSVYSLWHKIGKGCSSSSAHSYQSLLQWLMIE